MAKVPAIKPISSWDAMNKRQDTLNTASTHPFNPYYRWGDTKNSQGQLNSGRNFQPGYFPSGFNKADNVPSQYSKFVRPNNGTYRKPINVLGGSAKPGYANIPPNTPSYKNGGMVKKTGLALVHKGEKVLTTDQVKKTKKPSIAPVKKTKASGNPSGAYFLSPGSKPLPPAYFKNLTR